MPYHPLDHHSAARDHQLIDREGRIRYRQSQLMDKETLVRLFKEYVK